MIEKEKRNPNWTRDELILALDFYLKHRDRTPDKSSEQIARLSADINRLAQRLGMTASNTLRNINGVYMKLMNFRSHDPAFTDQGKVGLARGNKDEGVVWAQFANDPDRLSATANIIRSTLEADIDLRSRIAPEPDAEAPEGRLVARLHTVPERSRAIVSKKKAAFLKTHGRLFCEACGFSFSDKYGARGDGFIECHHTKPVHTLSPNEKTKLTDLALLCANCHRMVHVTSPWLSMDELKETIKEGTKS